MLSNDTESWKEIGFPKPSFLYLISRGRSNHEFHRVSQESGVGTLSSAEGLWFLSKLVVQGVRVLYPAAWLLSRILTALKCVGGLKLGIAWLFKQIMSPYSLMYLLFKSVILIFIATFCECTALLDSLGRNLSESMVIFLEKSLQTKTIRNICPLYHHSLPGECASRLT